MTGIEGTAEYEVAQHLAEQLGKLWPGLRSAPANREYLRIAANAKLSGYKVSDVDIVVAGGFFAGDRRFMPTHPVGIRGTGAADRKPIAVRNFIVAVEVKDHDPAGVRITGSSVSVRYVNNGRVEWSSATEQNVNQAQALRFYFRDMVKPEEPYIYRCLVMRGLPEVTADGAVAQAFDGPSFMTAVAAVNGVFAGTGGLRLSSTMDSVMRRALQARLFKLVIPTALDRKRMDAIVAGSPSAAKVLEGLGNKLVWLRGPGGTGKTVMLLHAALRAYRERGARILVLTYNHALASDIRRLLYLLKTPSGFGEGGVSVQTVMSFMSGLFSRLGVSGTDGPGTALDDMRYLADCQSALENIAGGAITPSDLECVFNAEPELFRFDAIVVDEAQDWPQPEAELLKAVYGARRICLGDGIEQMVRTRRATDWRANVPEGDIKRIALAECLRMKRNLAVFANVVLLKSGSDSDVTPSDAAGGGRVLILKRSLDAYPGLNDELVAEAKARGNDPVDLLNCVPSSDIEVVDEQPRSAIGRALEAAGMEVWDGVDERRRRDFPRSRSELRIVHYASCRGLEGWTVVLHGLDEYWSECYRVRHRDGLSKDELAAYADIEAVSAAYAWRRVAIAMLRPIETLVITLTDINSQVARVIESAATQCADFCEVRP